MQPNEIGSELRRLANQAPDAARRIVPDEPADARHHGFDPTGLVRATIDASGTVHDILVNGGWRNRIAASELGNAVRLAVAAAVTARLTAWEAAAAAAGPASDQLVSQLLSLAESLGPGIDHLLAQAEQLATQTWTGQSQYRHATATITGAREVIAVDYDQGWLADASATYLRTETRQAFEAAYAAAGQPSVEDLIAASPITEIRRLAANLV